MSFVFGAPASAKEADGTLTLTIDATCLDEVTLDGQHLGLNDKVIGTLSERSLYRIIFAEGGRLELDTIEHRDTTKISGGGTCKDPIESRSWRYNAGDPA